LNRNAWLGAVLTVVLPLSPAPAAGLQRTPNLKRINAELHGQVLDFTHNHGCDRRIWSEALQQKRDLYVYLPPHYDPHLRYPVMFWLHGFAQDEQAFLRYVVKPLDEVIVAGKLPPMIIAAPDGSLTGEANLMRAGTFFINSKAGNFADFLLHDVWNFVMVNFPIRPEREAHVLAGVSMGGGAAYDLGIKYRDRFKIVIGIFPPVNIRWLDCHCRYMRNFDPNCWGWRTDLSHGCEVVGRFFGVVAIRLRDVMDPIYDRKDPATLEQLSWQNPIELIDRLCLREGELCMYIGYGGKDQFNIDAQVESFLYRARERGLTVAVGYEPHGKHDVRTALKLFPGVVDWLGPLLAPYGPCP
jgi:hypothetical protein